MTNLKEMNYYSVWMEVGSTEAKVLGTNLEYDMLEMGEYTVINVSRKDLDYIVNTNWGFNKSEKFIENLAVKIEKEATKMYLAELQPKQEEVQEEELEMSLEDELATIIFAPRQTPQEVR